MSVIFSTRNNVFLTWKTIFLVTSKVFTASRNILAPLSANGTLECLSLWGIIKQITSGLAFIHSQGKLHRDLNPRNGTLRFLERLMIVLLSIQHAAWKIADFSLTSEGISTSIHYQIW